MLRAARTREELARARRTGVIGFVRFSYYEAFEDQLRPMEIDPGAERDAALAAQDRRTRSAGLTPPQRRPTTDADGNRIPNCIFPSQQTITTGEYPLSRRILLYTSTSGLRRPEVRAFLAYTLRNAQTLATDSRLVPITTRLRVDQHRFVTGVTPAPAEKPLPGEQPAARTPTTTTTTTDNHHDPIGPVDAHDRHHARDTRQPGHDGGAAPEPVFQQRPRRLERRLEESEGGTVTPPRPQMSDPSPLVDPPPTPIERRGRAARTVDSKAITTLTQALVEAEQRAVLAEDELEDMVAALERNNAQLGRVREEYEHLHGVLPAIQQAAQDAVGRSTQLELELAEQQRLHAALAEEVASERERVAECRRLVTQERASADAELERTQEQAAEAIRRAEGLASVALRGTRQTLEQLRVECEAQIQEAARAILEAQERAERAEVDADARVEQARVEIQGSSELAPPDADATDDSLAQEVIADAREIEAQAELAVRAQVELRLEAEARAAALETEVEELRRAVASRPKPVPAAPSEDVVRVRDELAAAMRENDELLERLQRNDRALRARERDLERERRVADEATRWASRAERALAAQPPADPAEPILADGAPSAARRRRAPRVRIRHGS